MKNIGEKREQALAKFRKLQAVAIASKKALIANRKENGAFVDNENMSSEGILSEATGLTGLLLMLEGFSSDIVNEADIKDIEEILIDSVEKIYGWINKSGFSAEPLVTNKSSKLLFDAENGYIDTITYVLSSMILAMNLKICKKIFYSDETERKVKEILANAFVQLITSQHDDGMWGFRADKESKSALYFTYSASVTIADFFDYILGEIAYTYDDLTVEEQEKKKAEIYERNKGFLAELDSLVSEKLGCGAEQAVVNAREAIRKWLVEECLCVLPDIARCHALNNDESKELIARLGIWDYTPDRQDEEAGYGPYVKYYNLNYVFYLIDMLVGTSSDKYFEDFVKNAKDEEIEAFKERCAVYLDEQDIKYYFGDGRNSENHLNDLWKSIIEQSIHSARANYMLASRTGDLFWNKAELQISWFHEDQNITRLAGKAYEKNSLKDPSIAPMALRSNVMYSYYISEQTDMTVDRLFDDICHECAKETEYETVAGLWDNNSFNLMVTERSIEALLDYSDYLIKFEELPEDVEPIKVEVPVKSELDIAFEEKIKDFLMSADGKSLIADAVGDSSNSGDAKASDNASQITPESFLGLLCEINEWKVTKLNQHTDLRMAITKELTSLVSKLMVCVLQKKICDWNDYENNAAWDAEKENAYTDIIAKQFDALILEMLNDPKIQEPTHTLQYLYNTLKFSDNK